MTTVPGFSARTDDYAEQVGRMAGHVGGIAEMIDEGRFGIDVLTQVDAVNSVLRWVALNLLDEHLGRYVNRASADGDNEASMKLTEAADAIAGLRWLLFPTATLVAGR